MKKSKKSKKKDSLDLSKENILITSIIIGVLLLSFGIYLIGVEFGSIGKNLIIFGSLLLYISTIVLAFIL